jgi:hypothetical protein
VLLRGLGVSLEQQCCVLKDNLEGVLREAEPGELQ